MPVWQWFLSSLATTHHVSASTQNQARSAFLSLHARAESQRIRCAKPGGSFVNVGGRSGRNVTARSVHFPFIQNLLAQMDLARTKWAERRRQWLRGSLTTRMVPLPHQRARIRPYCNLAPVPSRTAGPWLAARVTIRSGLVNKSLDDVARWS